MGYPCARLALRAQLKISDFLRAMADALLRDEPAVPLTGSSSWDDLIANSFVLDGHFREGSMLWRPFSAPPKFDSNRIVDIVQLKVRALEDELFQMQTDPMYIRDLLKHTRDSPRNSGLSQKDLQ